MKKLVSVGLLSLVVLVLFSFKMKSKKEETYTITVNVEGLRNSTGEVQYSIYDKDGTIPDKKYTKYYYQKKAKIVNGKSTMTFINMPKGRYAINILHDEDMDGQVKKGMILPIEGIGFSNFEAINLANRPNFKKASFEVSSNVVKSIKIIYM